MKDDSDIGLVPAYKYMHICMHIHACTLHTTYTHTHFRKDHFVP